MPRTTQTHKENRESIVLNAMLMYPSIPKIAKITGITEDSIRKMLENEDFQSKLADARQKATDSTIAYMQGNLNKCAEVLMNIVNDESISPQVRVNAVNSMFANLKILNNDTTKIFQGMAVQIIDNI